MDCSLQAPLSMGFSRQEYWSGLHAPLQGISLTQGFNPCLLCLQHWQANSLPLMPPGKPTRGLGSSNFQVGRGGEGGREIKPLCRASLVGRHDFLFLWLPGTVA